MNDAVTILTKNIKAAIAAAKKAGTCEMSLGNLKAITSTAGLSCPVPMYHAAFEEAAKNVAKSVRGFSIYS